MCLPKLPGYLVSPKRPAKMVKILPSRNHGIPSSLLLFCNSENLRVWYSDPLQIAVFAYCILVVVDNPDPMALT